MDNREEKRGEGEPQTKEEEKKESGEIGGSYIPTKTPFNLLYCLFKRVFLIPLTQTNIFNLTLITT